MHVLVKPDVSSKNDEGELPLGSVCVTGICKHFKRSFQTDINDGHIG